MAKSCVFWTKKLSGNHTTTLLEAGTGSYGRRQWKDMTEVNEADSPSSPHSTPACFAFCRLEIANCLCTTSRSPDLPSEGVRLSGKWWTVPRIWHDCPLRIESLHYLLPLQYSHLNIVYNKGPSVAQVCTWVCACMYMRVHTCTPWWEPTYYIIWLSWLLSESSSVVPFLFN